MPDDDPAWYLVGLPAPDPATLAQAALALEASPPDPTDRQAAGVLATATYLAHLARALTMREVRLGRLPQVDDGLAFLAGERDSEASTR